MEPVTRAGPAEPVPWFAPARPARSACSVCPSTMARRSALSERHASPAPARPSPEDRPAVPSEGEPIARSIRVCRSAITGMRAMFSTGTLTVTSGVARPSSSTIVTGRVPPRNRATSPRGETVADRPTRCAGRPRRSSRRSRESARCVPRLEPAKEWISSTMTLSTVRSVSRAALVSMRYSDSGVVMRISGGCVRNRRRSRAGVSPERTPTEMGRVGPTAPIPASGRRRLRSMSTPSALSGEM